jgi:DNA-binding transcriptional regulator YdaS (Cro superfamily)
VLERAEHLARRKEIYETLYPEAKEPERKRLGGKLRHRAACETVSQAVASFAADTAAKTGITPRTIQQDVQIATRIAADVREAIRDTGRAERPTAGHLRPVDGTACARGVAAGTRRRKRAAGRLRSCMRSVARRDRRPLAGWHPPRGRAGRLRSSNCPVDGRRSAPTGELESGELARERFVWR